MTILTVGNDISILKELSDELWMLCPSASLVIKTDPLMAGKYSFNHSVDILITEMNMKRMNGMQLIDFVRRENPEVLTYTLSTKEEIEKQNINQVENVTGIITYPFRKHSLEHLFREVE